MAVGVYSKYKIPWCLACNRRRNAVGCGQNRGGRSQKFLWCLKSSGWWPHFFFNLTSTPPSSVGSCRRRGRDCGLQYLTVTEGKVLYISAPLRLCGKRKKVSHRDTETQRKERNNALKSMREIKIWTVGENLNGEWAEDDTFSARFSFGTEFAIG